MCGVTNVPATFMNLIITILRDMGIFTFVFMDDTWVFSKNEEEHNEHLEKVLDVLRTHKLYAHKENVKFFTHKFNTLDMCCLNKVFQLIPKKSRLWLVGPCQRIRLRPDAFEVGCLHEEIWWRILSKLQPHDGFLKRITSTRDCHANFEALKSALTQATILRIMNLL